MEKFKVKKKHLTGEIADFPKRVVQAMVDEQVRQGNQADPSVFARKRIACKQEGGFTWMKTAPGYSWAEIILYKKFHLIPKREKPRLKLKSTRVAYQRPRQPKAARRIVCNRLHLQATDYLSGRLIQTASVSDLNLCTMKLLFNNPCCQD